MPVNAPAEYFRAEEKYKNAKNNEEKILALEEMIRLLPKHHGSEQMLAQLKSRLARLKEQEKTRKVVKGKRIGIAKEGEAQVCLFGFTQSGKSFLLSRLTDAKPLISNHLYTTTKPEIGMMDYKGVKLQLIEIPSTFLPEYISIARTADLIVLLSRSEEEKKDLERFLQENFIKTKYIILNAFSDIDEIKKKIWFALDLIIVYTKDKKPMALKKGSMVKDFAARIHKDFVKNFRFARLFRGNETKQVGLNYVLEDGDIVDVHTK